MCVWLVCVCPFDYASKQRCRTELITNRVAVLGYRSWQTTFILYSSVLPIAIAIIDTHEQTIQWQLHQLRRKQWKSVRALAFRLLPDYNESHALHNTSTHTHTNWNRCHFSGAFDFSSVRVSWHDSTNNVRRRQQKIIRFAKQMMPTPMPMQYIQAFGSDPIYISIPLK